MKFVNWTAVLCLGALAWASDVVFDYDRSANFSNYRTYQWADSAGRVNDQLMDQNLQRAIDAQLVLKGLQRVERGGDLKVTYRVIQDRETQFEGWGTGRWNGSSRVTTSTIDVATLAVDLVDLQRNQMVWRGAVKKTVDIRENPDKNYEKLQKTVGRLFKNYPPGSQK